MIQTPMKCCLKYINQLTDSKASLQQDFLLVSCFRQYVCFFFPPDTSFHWAVINTSFHCPFDDIARRTNTNLIIPCKSVTYKLCEAVYIFGSVSHILFARCGLLSRVFLPVCLSICVQLCSKWKDGLLLRSNWSRLLHFFSHSSSVSSFSTCWPSYKQQKF